MKDFEYAAPVTEAEVLELLSGESGTTELLAGGTDLIGLMKKMIVTPDLVVNIMDVPSLQSIEPIDAIHPFAAAGFEGGVSIGAAVTLDDILAVPYLENYPSVTQAIRGINSMQLQAQGTLGGELCQRPRCWFFRNGMGLMSEDGCLAEQGDNRFHAIFGNSGPARFVNSSRIAPALISLGAAVRIIGPSSDEETLLPVEDFYRTPRREGERETVLQPNQLVTHIVLPSAHGMFNATYEVRDTAGPDYPLAAAAAMLRMSSGVVRDARIVLGQVAPTPWASRAAAEVLVGRTVDSETAELAGQAAVSSATPMRDNEYKVQLAKVAVKRAILQAAGLETGGF